MREESLLRQEQRLARDLLVQLVSLLPAPPPAAGRRFRQRAGWPASKAAG